ncbi:hypothetical protein SAMN03097723_3531 [Pantoea eucalypti]|jgi:hypothetical protein|nr:hypothetical protein SAMN03097723_3531 [Pantoea eucalypti]
MLDRSLTLMGFAPPKCGEPKKLALGCDGETIRKGSAASLLSGRSTGGSQVKLIRNSEHIHRNT